MLGLCFVASGDADHAKPLATVAMVRVTSSIRSEVVCLGPSCLRESKQTHEMVSIVMVVMLWRCYYGCGDTL